MSASKRKCPKCQSENTGAVFNGYARDNKTAIGGCGCNDCKALWTEIVYPDGEIQIVLDKILKAEEVGL